MFLNKDVMNKQQYLIPANTLDALDITHLYLISCLNKVYKCK